MLRSWFRWPFLLVSFSLGPMECFYRVAQKRKHVVRLVLATKKSVFLLENAQGSANPKESLKATCSAAVLSQEVFLFHLFLEIVLLNKVPT